MMFPIASLDRIELAQANDLLQVWGHRMGPLERGNSAGWHYALFHGGEPVAVACTSTLIRERVGGGLGHLDRSNTIELSRLSADGRFRARPVRVGGPAPASECQPSA